MVPIEEQGRGTSSTNQVQATVARCLAILILYHDGERTPTAKSRMVAEVRALSEGVLGIGETDRRIFARSRTNCSPATATKRGRGSTPSSSMPSRDGHDRAGVAAGQPQGHFSPVAIPAALSVGVAAVGSLRGRAISFIVLLAWAACRRALALGQAGGPHVRRGETLFPLHHTVQAEFLAGRRGDSTRPVVVNLDR